MRRLSPCHRPRPTWRVTSERYFSEELDYAWVLRITNDSLSSWDPRTWDEFALRPVARDVFQSLEDGGTFTFSRDGQGRVVGFTFNTGRIRNLKFVRR